MMLIMALIDTGSNIRFMGQEILEELAPHLLQKLVPFEKRDIWRNSPCQGILIPYVQHRQ